jgi:hypothetical protein
MTAAVISDRLLALLVELDDLWRESRVKWSFTEVLSASGIKLSHPEMTREWASRSTARRGAQIADIEDLADAGLIAVDWGGSGNGRRGDLRLTPAGEAMVDRLASPSPAPSAPVGSDWHENIMPLLVAAADLESSLSPDGLVTQDALNTALGRPQGDPQTSTTLMQLSAAGYFRDEVSVEQADGPLAVRLGEKALQRVAGWPGESGDLASALLELIDRRLADPEVSEDERGRLERLRQALSDVGKGVVTGLLTGLVKSHLG